MARRLAWRRACWALGTQVPSGQALAGEVRNGGDVAGSPGVVDDAFVAADAQVRQDADAAAGLQREVGGADHRVGLHAGSPHQGVGFEILGQGLVREVDQLEAAFGVVQGGVQQDLDAAAAEVLHNPLGLRGRDLGHDAAHGFNQDEADFLLLDAGVVADSGAGQVLHLGDALDAGETAAHHHEGEGRGALGRVRHGGAELRCARGPCCAGQRLPRWSSGRCPCPRGP